jgi:hypothetical protein
MHDRDKDLQALFSRSNRIRGQAEVLVYVLRHSISHAQIRRAEAARIREESRRTREQLEIPLPRLPRLP